MAANNSLWTTPHVIWTAEIAVRPISNYDVMEEDVVGDDVMGEDVVEEHVMGEDEVRDG